MSQSSLLTPRFFGPQSASFGSWELIFGVLEPEEIFLTEFFDFVKKYFFWKKCELIFDHRWKSIPRPTVKFTLWKSIVFLCYSQVNSLIQNFHCNENYTIQGLVPTNFVSGVVKMYSVSMLMILINSLWEITHSENKYRLYRCGALVLITNHSIHFK